MWPTASEPDARGLGEVSQSLRSLFYYHQDVLTFHRYFLNCATHTYGSKPSGWLLVNRPVGADAQLDIQPGEQGCDAAPGSDCLRQVLIIGNPVLWWGCLVALIASAVLWVGTRDWRYGVAVVGTLATWLPWLLYDDRPIFIFYSILALPFLVLAATLVMGRLLGSASGPVGASYRRGGRRGLLLRARAGQLRLVLADLDRPAADPPGVDGADLVRAVDLTDLISPRGYRVPWRPDTPRGITFM